MRLLYLSNYYNHHQKPLADALYALLGKDYNFVETTGVPDFRKKLGYQEITAPYVIKYNDHTKGKIDNMIMEADVVIYGEAPLCLIKKRLGARRLTFRDDECRYRSITRFLKWPIYTYNSLYLNKGYLLSASAYGPVDYLLSGMNPKKCFRWGYFTKVKDYGDPQKLICKKNSDDHIRILWCGRLIPLKHPEAFIYVAEKLRVAGYNFELNVLGTGKLESKLKLKVNMKGLNGIVNFHGSMPPEEVRKYMESSDIFLFTSDRNEGWGAVLNESMNSGCAVVAANNIGSVPYLIQDSVNGLVFNDLDWSDLYIKVKWLIDHPDERREIGKKAYVTMKDVWNGNNAAKNLLTLCNALLSNDKIHIMDGPCSKAPLLLRRWHGKIKIL